MQLWGSAGNVTEDGSGGSPVGACWQSAATPGGVPIGTIESGVARALTAPRLAPIDVVPKPSAVANPEPLTEATEGLSEVHVAAPVKSWAEPSE